MSEQNARKINKLLETLGDTDLVSAHWLREHGYSSSLVARYVASGWLASPARGVYARKGGVLVWEGVLHSLQALEQLPLHAGGRFSLAWHGHEHYLRLGEAATVTLYGPARLPGWVPKLKLPERFEHCGKGPFNLPPLPFTATLTNDELYEHGLEQEAHTSLSANVILASDERAMLELCDAPPDAGLVYEVDSLMQGLAGLRPELVSRLLRHCRSVKAKRLFLALAERHAHAWFARLALGDVNLGSGKRVLVTGGRLHPKYHITLPEDLDAHLG